MISTIITTMGVRAIGELGQHHHEIEINTFITTQEVEVTQGATRLQQVLQEAGLEILRVALDAVSL